MRKYNLFSIALISIFAHSYPIILNEYNGVDANETLKNGGYDSFYGRVVGNGGDWVEMVVVGDDVNVSGSLIEIKGNGGVYFLGRLPYSSLLSNLQRGTILTISKEPTNLSYDPFNECSPDWDININYDDITPIEGNYEINHNEIRVSLKSENGKYTLLKDSGERIFGGGIDKEEIFLLKTNPSEDILPDNENYGDSKDKQPLSTFGSPNRWIDDNNNTISQDLTPLRLEAKRRYFLEQKPYLILNEYNGVSSSEYLKGDGNDSYFGRVLGNGGDWIELVVIKDRLDLRSAIIKIEENCQEIFSAKFPLIDTLGFLRKGTLFTISNEPTNMSYFPFSPSSGDWYINFNIDDFIDRNGTFNVGDKNTTITIIREDGAKFRLVKSGEGVIGRDILDNKEVFKLRAEPTQESSPYINYGDDNNSRAISTFGSPNSWIDENGTFTTQQMTIRENRDLVEVDGIALSKILDLSTLKDGESLLYIGVNNSLWIADDDSHQLFELDYTTHEVKSLFNDRDFGGFTNGDIKSYCSYGEGACDIEEVAYDEVNDVLYVLTGKSPGTPAIYKLTRDNVNEGFEISDYRKLDNIEYPSAIFINGDFLVSIGKSLYLYDFDSNQVSQTPIFSIEDDVGDFVGLAYSPNTTTLWITTLDKNRLIKVDWSTKSVEAIYDMDYNGVYDARGIEVIDNRLHILEGYDRDVPQSHVLRNGVHIYQTP